MKTLYNTVLVLVVACLSIFNASAARQELSTINGSIISSTDNQPVAYATLAVMHMDSTIVTGVACDEDGKYSITNLQHGDYILSASMIGYTTSYKNVRVSNPAQEIEPLYISEDAQMLQSAVLTEKVKLVEMKIDKVVMNVSQSAFSQGSNALELIKKAPGVTVDKDGNVKLNGKTVAVWIDGRPSYLDGKSLEALLRSTNSESIEKFELMEHPSSKYDAQGQGGIINIKTKKNLAAGFNGSMGLGGGGMYFPTTDRGLWQESCWLNLGLRTKKTNTYFSIYEGFYNSDVDIDNNLAYAVENMTLDQKSESLFANKYHNYNVKLGHDWFIDDKNTVGAIFYMPGDRSRMYTLESSSEQWINDAKVQDSNSDIHNLSHSLQFNANVNYTHVFDESKSQEITVNLDYYRNGSNADNQQHDQIVFAADPDKVVLQDKTINSDNVYNIYSAKADFQSVLWQKVMFESGAKWAMSQTDNNSIELATGVPDLLSEFTYREHIAAAYFTMAGQFGKQFSAKIGLRGEYTNSFGDWRTAGEQTRRDYFDVFPTAYFGYMPTEKCRLSLSFSRRVSRPNYYQLDPTKNYIDAHSFTVGNPDLLPSYSNDVTFSTGFGQHLSLSAGYQYTTKVLSQIPSFDQDGTEYLTWGNFGKQHLAFMNFSVAALPVTKWFDWTLSVTGLYGKATFGGVREDNNSLGAQAYTDFTFNLPKDWKISMDANYQTPMSFGLYKIRSVFVSNFAVKKTLLDNRMTLTFKVDDVFNTQTMNLVMYTADGSNNDLSIAQKYYSTKAIFDITWSFGKAQQTKARKVGNLDEMSRIGSGKK